MTPDQLRAQIDSQHERDERLYRLRAIYETMGWSEVLSRTLIGTVELGDHERSIG